VVWVKQVACRCQGFQKLRDTERAPGSAGDADFMRLGRSCSTQGLWNGWQIGSPWPNFLADAKHGGVLRNFFPPSCHPLSHLAGNEAIFMLGLTGTCRIQSVPC